MIVIRVPSRITKIPFGGYLDHLADNQIQKPQCRPKMRIETLNSIDLRQKTIQDIPLNSGQEYSKFRNGESAVTKAPRRAYSQTIGHKCFRAEQSSSMAKQEASLQVLMKARFLL